MSVLTLPGTRNPTTVLPPELDRPFAILAFDWDGTAVVDRHEDTAALRPLLERLLQLGVYVAIITGTNFLNIDRQFAGFIRGPHKRRLYVLTNRGSEVYGFDDQSRPVLLWKRSATPEEERLLTQAADRVRDSLAARTGLAIQVIYDRLNRRKIDLIPVPEWSDPPKSALKALLQAVEARLHRAGLAGGLRAALELAEHLARTVGLPDPRITSDVKHIEIGLTDKSDAVAWVMGELARKHSIRPEDVLIAGDEFGSLGGVPGSDSKMMAPEARGAVVVSVGPEPEGVPPGVIHLGGGPACFRELLLAQVAAQERQHHPASAALLVAPSIDPDWLLVEEGYQLAREHEIESLFTTANGYAGSRASVSEGTPLSQPATFVAGVFEVCPAARAIPELAKTPDWTNLRVMIGDHPVHLGGAETLQHHRLLDLRQGLLWRKWRFQDPAGRITRLGYLRLASLADRHLFLQTVTLTAENYSGPVVLDSRFVPVCCQTEEPTAARLTVGADRVLPTNGKSVVSPVEVVMEQAVAGSAIRVALGSLSELHGANDSAVTPPLINDTTGLVQRWHWDAAIGQTYRLDRLVSLYTSRDTAQPAAAAAAQLSEAWGKGIAAVVTNHVRAWQERWQDAEVEVEGDPEVQRALRFAAYHLISAANPDDEHVSIGARGLTGEAYKGHVFWDTDIFMLPFYIYTHPPTARALEMYRYHTLPAAREKARAFGYRGALYAWESADTGAEITPPFALAADGTVLRILTGEQEHHISADVAYGVWHYWQATGDEAFFLAAGAEILFETARFWASRGQLGPDGRYHITHVIGPDEYHEGIDDDAYTNVMAQWNLERAVEAAGFLEVHWPQRQRELFEHLGVTSAELEQWRDTAAKMYTGFQPTTHLFEQCRGYFGLEDIGLAAFEPRTVPMDVILGRERTQRSQVVKQADVVMLLYLLWDRLSPEVREANFRYYEPRTAHGSSLSPAIYAAVAARLGQGPLAGRYVRQAAQIDLANSMGNAAGGVHMAALGGLWQAAVMGCGGLTLRADGLSFAPFLLPSWRRLSFPVQWRGRKVAVTLSGPVPEIRLIVHGTAPMVVAVNGGPAVTALPERHYVCRWTENGWEAWQSSEP